MKSVTITLDGKEHIVQELRHRENRKWRAEFKKILEGFTAHLDKFGDVSTANMPELVDALNVLIGYGVGSFDVACELLVLYDPELTHVMDDVYDSEVLDAFKEVLSLAFPFGNLPQELRQIGQRLEQMSQN